MDRRIGVNDAGISCGQDHHRAKLTDHEVELIRQLHEDGLSYGQLADKFGVNKATVADICKYRRRLQVATRWKVIKRK